MFKYKIIVLGTKKLILLGIAVIILAAALPFSFRYISGSAFKTNSEMDYIKWMEFNLSAEILAKAMKLDIETYNTENPIDWIELLAYVTAKNWGRTNTKTLSRDIDEAVAKVKSGALITDLGADLKYFEYYLTTYSAVLGEFLGVFEQIIDDSDNPGSKLLVRKYGMKVFSPIAKGYDYTHYDDFGSERSYGYRRRHLGNDLMGRIGTPIIAVECGIVEALGWNRYGGWRVGIRSLDGERYYYYAHLRKDHPFVKSLSEGDRVSAGDVIGYLGMTGYSTRENVNNITTPHLHFGMQIIFDESQKDGRSQIWIDVYNIVKLLSRNRMPVRRCELTGDYERALELNFIPLD